MDKDKNHFDNISLFIITTHEYLEFNKLFHESKQEFSEELAIKVKSMLVRKYLTKKDNVHIGKIIDELSERYLEEKVYLQNLKERYIKIYQGSIIQVDSIGNEYNQIDVLEDMIYGLYLHADSERVERLKKSNNASRIYMLNEFISKMEVILLELYEFIINKMGKGLLEKTSLDRAVVIRDKNFGRNTDLLEDGYWGNLRGEKIIDESSVIKNFDKEDLKTIKIVLDFFQFFQEERISYSDAKKFVFKPVLKDWGDFSKTKEIMLTFNGNIGYSDKIKYNDKKNTAWVTIFKNVDYGFVINEPQLVEATIITLVKNRFMQWKVFSLGKVDNPFNGTK